MRSKVFKRRRTRLIVMKVMLLLMLLYLIYRPLIQQIKQRRFQSKIIGEFSLTSITMENVIMKNLNHLQMDKLCIDQGKTKTLLPFLWQMENLPDPRVTKLELKFAKVKLFKMEISKPRHMQMIASMLSIMRTTLFIMMFQNSH